MVPLLLYVRVIHLKLFPHGALYFCCQGVLEGEHQKVERFSVATGTIQATDRWCLWRRLTMGNSPREWNRRGVFRGRVLFLRFFSSSWASWSISMHSVYLSSNSRNWETQNRRTKTHASFVRLAPWFKTIIWRRDRYRKSRLRWKSADRRTSAVSCRWASFAAPKCWVSSSFSKACWEHSRE